MGLDKWMYFCITWRKDIRRVWGLPYNTHCDILPVLCDALPVFEVLCKRVLSFLLTCINSDCNIVSLCLDMQSFMVVCCRHSDAMHCIVVYGTALILAVSSVH